MEELRKVITDIQQSLKENRYSNEDAIKQGIILRILSKLGWDTYDTESVWPEFPLQDRRVDYALCDTYKKPKAFIEAKAPGKIEGGLDQLTDYTYRTHGSTIPVLTDGQEWQFFYPMGSGTPQDRRVYKLDLLEREPLESARILYRYLGKEPVHTGVALADIQKDYENKTKRDNAERSLPRAWEALVEERDSLLVDLIAEKVADITGHKPEPDRVLKFLSNLQPFTPAKSVFSVRPAEKRDGKHAAAGGRMGFEYFGAFHQAPKVREVLIGIIEELCKRKGFADAFMGISGTTRRYLARSPGELYPEKSRYLANQGGSVEQLSNGYYLMTNVGKGGVARIVQQACEAAGIEYGKDIVVHL